MSEGDQALLRAVLYTAVEGPYFPDWEFSILMGMSRSDMAAMADAWPEPVEGIRDDPVHAQQVAINSALNNLTGYPHHNDDVLRDALGVGREGLCDLLDRWKHGRTP